MSDALWIALLSGPVVLGLREGVAWLRNHGKEEAEAALTVDQRWEKLADQYEGRITALEERVTAVEDENSGLRDRLAAALAEVDRYRAIARSLLRQVLRLRESLATQGVEAPPLPSDIEDAFTSLDLPH
ncbi:MAG: hypothetical protein J7518_20420 [Nocardioidaceae bacterium]|nr:hypothetical protein [Nocardioidaceae bacterium]